MDTESLIFFRGTEQEVSAKITRRIVVSLVSAVFDQLEKSSPFTIIHDKDAVSTQKHLGSNGASMDNELSADHSARDKNKDNVNESTLFRKWMFKPEN